MFKKSGFQPRLMKKDGKVGKAFWSLWEEGETAQAAICAELGMERLRGCFTTAASAV